MFLSDRKSYALLMIKHVKAAIKMIMQVKYPTTQIRTLGSLNVSKILNISLLSVGFSKHSVDPPTVVITSSGFSWTSSL